MLRMTQAAAIYARHLATQMGCEPVLRVRAIAGGCNGLTWDIAIGDVGSRPGDQRRLNEGVDVVVDPVSAPLLAGAVVDVGEPGGSGLRDRMMKGAKLEFRLTSLPAKHVCTCGESFEPGTGST